MAPLTLLLLYALALFAASLAGGGLPRYFAMTHTRAQLAMSFVSGVMLGIAFLHLLPHALVAARGVDAATTVMNWAILGLVVMLLLLRLLHFHQPDYPAQEDMHAHHDHATHDGCDASPAAEHGEAPRVDWGGVFLGLLFHTLVDGVALGAALLGDPGHDGDAILGFGVFLAIVLHKPLDAMSITALMKAGGASLAAQRLANFAFAAVCPLGALLFYLVLGGSGDLEAIALGPALAFTAGAFVCIALGDLLPEVQFHSHDRIKLTLAFLLGISLAFALTLASPQHHDVVPPLSIGSGR